jgi:hypothetical protein
MRRLMNVATVTWRIALEMKNGYYGETWFENTLMIMPVTKKMTIDQHKLSKHTPKKCFY